MVLEIYVKIFEFIKKGIIEGKEMYFWEMNVFVWIVLFNCKVHYIVKVKINSKDGLG